jgi:hypothetical protein
MISRLGGAAADRPAYWRSETVRISLWAVFGLWLARRLARLFLLIIRSPTAVIGITIATAGVAGWQLLSPWVPISVVGVVVNRPGFCGDSEPTKG